MMTAPALRMVALLACMGAASASQQPQPATQTLDEVNVAVPHDRERGAGAATVLHNPHRVTVALKDTISVELRVVKEQTQVVFRRKSNARRLPDGGKGAGSNLELRADRIIALRKPWISKVRYLIDANVDEVDGVPVHIPFGPETALVNLEYLGLRKDSQELNITLANALHPQARQCERSISVGEFWPAGTKPYILVGKSLQSCAQAVKAREGELLFAAGMPDAMRQAVQQLYDPIASRLSNRLGSEPGFIFVVWWEDSPHEGYRLERGWNRNSLLLLNGAAWQQGIDAASQESLRTSLMREQIQRRISEEDWPGPFTESAASYLLQLTRSDEEHGTIQRLSQELPRWIAGCATQSASRAGSADPTAGVSGFDCGMVLQFVYDAVARAKSGGKENIYDTWRTLLDAAYRRKRSGVIPAEFMASSDDARRIAQGLIDGNVDWSQFGAALADVGVQLRAAAGGSPTAFKVQSLQYFAD